jgi:DNA-binding transcriptional ArsR family regulator
MDDRLDAVAHGLADRTRRRILARLAATPGLTTGELARSRSVSRWAVLKHLAALRRAGLIVSMPEGRKRRHYLNRSALEPLRAWLENELRSASPAAEERDQRHHQ